MWSSGLVLRDVDGVGQRNRQRSTRRQFRLGAGLMRRDRTDGAAEQATDDLALVATLHLGPDDGARRRAAHDLRRITTGVALAGLDDLAIDRHILATRQFQPVEMQYEPRHAADLV